MRSPERTPGRRMGSRPKAQQSSRDMDQIRCGQCNKLLAKGEALNLAIKCPRCGAMNHVRAASPRQEAREAPTGAGKCG
ncbi:Com family DNA-binding transcriptional regulator [Megalodesulfovibrio paquesii]